jgi:hypothetical protein
MRTLPRVVLPLVLAALAVAAFAAPAAATVPADKRTVLASFTQATEGRRACSVSGQLSRTRAAGPEGLPVRGRAGPAAALLSQGRATAA